MTFKMKFTITSAHIDNELNRSGKKALDRQFCTVQHTGIVNATARSQVEHLNRMYRLIKGEYFETDGTTPFRRASAHTYTDDKDILVAIPFEEKIRPALGGWLSEGGLRDHRLRDNRLPRNSPRGNGLQDNRLFAGDVDEVAVANELCYFEDRERTAEAYEKFVWLNAYTAHLYGWKDIKRRFMALEAAPLSGRNTDSMTAFSQLGVTYADFLKAVAAEYRTCSRSAMKPSRTRQLANKEERG